MARLLLSRPRNQAKKNPTSRILAALLEEGGWRVIKLLGYKRRRKKLKMPRI
jgi:hypothetical protein